MWDASSDAMTYRGGIVGCPDPERLAQLGTDTLSDDERGALLDHAAGCSDCHAIVAVFADQPVRVPPPQAARLDRYELRRIVGVGAMGAVYAAFDPELDREIAVKVLRPNASAARLRREAQALAKLADPNVVRVYDVGEHDGKTFIAMELVEGENLREWLRTPHTIVEIVEVLIQAGRGLAAAHRAGLVHRDFKPDNVMLARTGGVLVGDFGLARNAELTSSTEAVSAVAAAELLSSQSLTVTGALVGTPAYMAPEQTRGEATPASDQYAYCVTAWEACFGERPSTPIELHKPAAHAVPKQIEQTLRRGLSARPQARFPNMDALVKALVRPRRSRWPWLAAGALVLTALTAVIVVTTTSSSAVRCDDAGKSIALAWTPAIEAQLTEHRGAGVAYGFARYAARWQQQRIAACLATHQRHEQTVTTLEHQVACLDRARAALHTTIATLLDPSIALPRPAEAVQSLPSLARCEGAVDAQVLPPPDRSAAITALDVELAKVDTSLLAGAPSVSAVATVELRRRAESLAFPPQLFRAMLLEARVANWNGDPASAETVLRRTLLLADQAADDLTRAHAGALLADVINDRTDEAAGVLAAARAALDRAGTDPEIEQALLVAEAAIATSRGDLREAVAAHEQIVALARTRFGDDSPILAHAYSRLEVAWAEFGDLAKAMAAQRAAIEIVTRIEKDGPPDDVKAVLRESIVELVNVGDFEGAAELGRRQLAAMRGLPAHSLKTEAYTAAQLAFALELDGRYREAAAAYGEAEQLWSRPSSEFATVGEEPDPVAIANGVADAAFSRATCLLRMHLAAEAVTELQRARKLAVAGDAATVSLLEPITRWLGQALVAAKRYREARDVLEPTADQLTTNAAIKPFPRAIALFALAQALWADGGARDRSRALAFADDAERHLATAIADGETHLYLRKLPPQARAELAAIAAWRASRVAP
jgi:tRNA A-37 threonylcarbamoyl transferase component Bud32/tetratricopeptide (TPR) repeat protein